MCARACSAGGIGGIRLAADDRVVAGGVAATGASTAQVALVLGAGYASVPLADFPTQGRNGKGIGAAKSYPADVADVVRALLEPEDRLVCAVGRVSGRISLCAAPRQMGRPASGRRCPVSWRGSR